MDNISDILLDWYARHGRDLPWRRTRDPYRIWLSEVILQQTRVAQGMDYYLRFTERFPDVGSLAAAPEDEVLKLWQGLGYYSRACNLHAAARQVAERFGGVFPRSYDEVRSLRGVGDYTAAAESTETTSSGVEVPTATIVRPMMNSGTRKRCVTAAEPSVRKFAPARISPSPTISSRMSIIYASRIRLTAMSAMPATTP